MDVTDDCRETVRVLVRFPIGTFVDLHWGEGRKEGRMERRVGGREGKAVLKIRPVERKLNGNLSATKPDGHIPPPHLPLPTE